MNSSTIVAFWSRQISQIKEENWMAVRRNARLAIIKLVKLPVDIIGYTLAVPIVLFVRLIRQYKLIRFGYFFAGRIGHFAFDVEYYLTEKKLGLHPEKATDIFFYRWLMNGKTANRFFSLMTKRNIKTNCFVKYMFFTNCLFPGYKKHQILPAEQRYGSRDTKGLLRQAGPQLSFTKVEDTDGQAFLNSIGMDKDEKFVCLIVRDSAYLKNAEYHNYRDSDIDAYKQAALSLAEKGYWVFRMGKVIHKTLNINHPKVVDYASSKYRSDFLDIWLMANCFFCISTGTGLDEVSRIFRRPAVYVNNLPLQQMVTYDHVISIPKHLLWQETNKQLTQSEHLAHSYYRTEQYENAKILVDDLTAEDIKQAVLEKEARLNGTWKDSEENRRLQDRFWEIFQAHQDFHSRHGKIHPEARVGAHFLRNNPEWLN